MIAEVFVNYDNELDNQSFDLTIGGRMFFCRNRVVGDDEKTESRAQIITRDNARNLAAHLQRWADTGRWSEEDTWYPRQWYDAATGAPVNADALYAKRSERDAATPALDNGATPAHKVGDLFVDANCNIRDVGEIYHDGVQYVYKLWGRALTCYDLVSEGWRKLRKVTP